MRGVLGTWSSGSTAPGFRSWVDVFGASLASSFPFQELFIALGRSPIGIAICDRRLRFVTVNHRLADINGIPLRQHPGHQVRDIVGGLAPTIEFRLEQVFRSDEPLPNAELVGRLGANPKVDRWVENYFPLRDRRGRVTQVGVFLLSLSELPLLSQPPFLASERGNFSEAQSHQDRSLRRNLSPRETHVLTLLANGQSAKEAAADMGISFKTVHMHRAHLMLKLGARSTADLVHHAIRLHLVELHG